MLACVHPPKHGTENNPFLTLLQKIDCPQEKIFFNQLSDNATFSPYPSQLILSDPAYSPLYIASLFSLTFQRLAHLNAGEFSNLLGR
jgi:hypothetical protein